MKREFLSSGRENKSIPNEFDDANAPNVSADDVIVDPADVPADVIVDPASVEDTGDEDEHADFDKELKLDEFRDDKVGVVDVEDEVEALVWCADDSVETAILCPAVELHKI